MTPPVPEPCGLTRSLPPGPADLRRTAGIENAIRRLLPGGVMPLRPGTGLTRIEDTAGPRESAPHSPIFTDTGVPA